MDYGHSNGGSKKTGIFSSSAQYQQQPQESMDTPYFTAGVGNMPAEANDFEPENNLDEENWQQSLKISAPVNLPTPEALQEQSNHFFNSENTIGNFPSDFSEDLSDESSEAEHTDREPTNTPENSHELGQIIPISTPARDKSRDSSQDAIIPTIRYNPSNIRTNGDRLEKSTIPEIDNTINELNQTGNLSNFYDEIRGTDEKPGMMEVNLNNSFNRKLGQDQIYQNHSEKVVSIDDYRSKQRRAA